MVEYEKEGPGAEQEEIDLEEIDLEELKELNLVGEVGQEADGGDQPDTPTSPPEPPNILDYSAKVYAMELVSGEFIRGTGTARSYLRLWNGEDVDKVRVMGTIVQTFLSNDGNYCALTLDDGTETIRVKGWREDARMMEAYAPGGMVDIIGGVREYDGEIYLSPIAINGISDANWEPLRELEIFRLRKVKKSDLQL
jgi:hypothetical protein